MLSNLYSKMFSRTKHCEMDGHFIGWVAHKWTNFSADKNKFLEFSTRLDPRAGPTRVHLWRKMTSLNTKIYRKSRNKTTRFRERSKVNEWCWPVEYRHCWACYAVTGGQCWAVCPPGDWTRDSRIYHRLIHTIQTELISPAVLPGLGG